uniref:Uncharacterized protein n=1 Tax=Vibrio parahaemolyticus TaxID=670 RepID=A0A1Y1BGA8_VIBPH|nr:hypothetical protein [Vibrio parahaemolyticus]
MFFWIDEQFHKKVVQLLFDRHWFFLNAKLKDALLVFITIDDDPCEWRIDVELLA